MAFDIRALAGGLEKLQGLSAKWDQQQDQQRLLQLQILREAPQGYVPFQGPSGLELKYVGAADPRIQTQIAAQTQGAAAQLQSELAAQAALNPVQFAQRKRELDYQNQLNRENADREAALRGLAGVDAALNPLRGDLSGVPDAVLQQQASDARRILGDVARRSPDAAQSFMATQPANIQALLQAAVVPPAGQPLAPRRVPVVGAPAPEPAPSGGVSRGAQGFMGAGLVPIGPGTGGVQVPIPRGTGGQLAPIPNAPAPGAASAGAQAPRPNEEALPAFIERRTKELRAAGAGDADITAAVLSEASRRNDALQRFAATNPVAAAQAMSNEAVRALVDQAVSAPARAAQTAAAKKQAKKEGIITDAQLGEVNRQEIKNALTAAPAPNLPPLIDSTGAVNPSGLEFAARGDADAIRQIRTQAASRGLSSEEIRAAIGRDLEITKPVVDRLNQFAPQRTGPVIRLRAKGLTVGDQGFEFESGKESAIPGAPLTSLKTGGVSGAFDAEGFLPDVGQLFGPSYSYSLGLTPRGLAEHVWLAGHDTRNPIGAGVPRFLVVDYKTEDLGDPQNRKILERSNAQAAEAMRALGLKPPTGKNILLIDTAGYFGGE